VVFVGDRRPEQGKYAVPGALHYVAAVAMHSVHHQTQHRVDDRAGLFGVEIAL
jgi:hypothetical protein